VPNVKKQKHNQDIPGSISEVSDSENSDDSANLIIKEDTEEDTEANEKEIKNTIIKTIEKRPNECQEVKEELNVENKAIKEEKEEVKPEDCPPSTCEVIIYLCQKLFKSHVSYYVLDFRQALFEFIAIYKAIAST